MSDNAIYNKINAEPTGGAGSIGILIGENSNIIIEKNRGSHFENVYDFYKPVPETNYPVVNGKLSV
jgi:3-hydroxy-3-methylglutaryl CoA synthase